MPRREQLCTYDYCSKIYSIRAKSTPERNGVSKIESLSVTGLTWEDKKVFEVSVIDACSFLSEDCMQFVPCYCRRKKIFSGMTRTPKGRQNSKKVLRRFFVLPSGCAVSLRSSLALVLHALTLGKRSSRN